MTSNQTIKWTTAEHDHQKRGSDWYWVLGILSLAVAISVAFLGNAMLGIIIVVAAAGLMLVSREGPREIDVTISPRGVKIRNDLYRFDNLKSFWIEEEEEDLPTLILHSERLILPHIRIHIEEVDPDEVRSFLLSFLPEKEHEPGLAEGLSRFFGF